MGQAWAIAWPMVLLLERDCGFDSATAVLPRSDDDQVRLARELGGVDRLALLDGAADQGGQQLAGVVGRGDLGGGDATRQLAVLWAAANPPHESHARGIALLLVLRHAFDALENGPVVARWWPSMSRADVERERHQRSPFRGDGVRAASPVA